MKGMLVKSGLCALLLMLLFSEVIAQAGKAKLFLPNQKKDWYIFLEKSGKGNDPNKVFTFEKDVLHVSGQDFGYISTTKKYSNFHLTVWFKWGEKKYPPRENAKRDAGVLYLADYHDGDKVWPRSIEFQIQEGDCGDFWMVDSTTIVFKNKITIPENWHREIKLADGERRNGEWNKVDVIVKDGKITHKINDVIVNEGSDPSNKEGYIVLQSEGAEIFYKDVTLEKL